LPDSVAGGSVLMFVVGLGLMGPYSLVSGTYAVDIGGLSDSGMAAGTADVFGYTAAVTVLALSGHLSHDALFDLLLVLAALAWCASVALAVLWRTVVRDIIQ
jgi:hypothetical protein